MKNSIISITLAAALVVLLAPTWVVGDQTETGNGCPSGAHYNLNLIGMGKLKNVDPDSITSQGHRIFVQLGNKDNTAKSRPCSSMIFVVAVLSLLPSCTKIRWPWLVMESGSTCLAFAMPMRLRL